ncbi:MAG TPA: acyltransferase family protein [Solirubrobacterales bacterium]|nr:acyltransferase [Solirubrobacterales bacterium]HMX71967.1 acyltransferase family protein [Solirubrobacterales bacterium]HMY26796.1 acyltransferase family protein [Solirubrobacterales bacterium]HNE78885.1 acyltransferase family protein [Solirubrobacterales bacterium]HNK35818.1 acyltransferase family protein [Solirubrobacterales bacterium]
MALGGAEVAARESGSPTAKAAGSNFRPDIQGIRAIAVTLVLACHASIPWAKGGFIGVDVFYVLSGFLITGLVVREIEKTGKVSIRNFYARRAKRLLPMAALVLVFICIGTLFIFSLARQVEIGGDVFAAALYFVNWHFIIQGVDYFAAADGIHSPVQHYWSLSVEEQFYVVWPLILLAAGALAAKFRRPTKGLVLIFIVPVAIASLIYSIHFTQVNPEAAFFSTIARAWQLAFGAVLAMILPKKIGMPAWLATVIGVIAVGVLGWATYTMSASTPFPGSNGLYPVGATIALLVVGASGAGITTRILSTRPFQYLGNISYSWYLWHWPFVVFALGIFDNLNWHWLVVATLISWIPTQISHTLLEDPVRRAKILKLRPNRALAIGGACSIAAAAFGLWLGSNRINVNILDQDQVAGAAVIKNGHIPLVNSVDSIKPNPLHARDDRGQMYADGCLLIGPRTESGECVYGDPDGDVSVVLFGDSHSMMYMPALDAIGKEKGWKITGLSRANCVIADVKLSQYCDEWRENSLERIQEEHPDLVVVATSTQAVYSLKKNGKQLSRLASEPYLVDGMARTFRQLEEDADQVVLLRDQAQAPRQPWLPHECVAENLHNLKTCAFAPKRHPELGFDVDAAEKTGVQIIDPMPILCSDGRCPVVIGNALVYRDSYHVSATYMVTMAPWLEQELAKLNFPANSR